MRISEHFGNQYLRAEDFDRSGQLFTIASAEMRMVGKDEKICLSFEEVDEILPLNKVNATSIAELYGDDTDDWTGNQIRVHADKTDFNGKRVSCLRVASPAAPQPRNGSANPNPSPKPNKGSSKPSRNTSHDEDVPF